MTSTLNALQRFQRTSMNSSQYCLSNQVLVGTILATHIRAENRREGENKLLALDWAQSSALKRADVDEVRSKPLQPLLILLVNMSLLKIDSPQLLGILWRNGTQRYHLTCAIDTYSM